MLHIQPWSAIFTGTIETVDSIRVIADLVVLNSGTIDSEKMAFVCPVFMNMYKGKNNETERAKLGNHQLRLLIVESLLSLWMGSTKHAKTQKLKSVLHFEFDGKSTTNRPDGDQLNHWDNTLKTSLNPAAEKINEGSYGALKDIVDGALADMPKVVCNLSASNLLCKKVMGISEKIKSNGIESFKLDELCGAMSEAHTRYKTIFVFEKPINAIKKLKKTIIDAKNYIAERFGPLSYANTLTFDSPDTIKEGIEEASYISFRDEASHVFTEGHFRAQAKTWENSGNITCGDLMIESDYIKQNSLNKRGLRALNDITLCANKELYARNIAAKKNITLQSSGNTTIENIKSEGDTHIDSKQSVTATGVHSKNLGIKAGKDAVVSDVTTESGDEAGIVVVKAGRDASITSANVTSLDVQGGRHASAGNVKAKEMVRVKAKEGKTSLTGKVEAETAIVEGGKEGLSIVGRNGKADHEVKTLKLLGKEIPMNDIEDMLSGKGAYESLSIKDHLDLQVPDQNIIVAHTRVDIKHSLSIKAKSMTLDKTEVKSKKNINIESAGDLKMKESSVDGNNVKLESKNSIHAVDSCVKANESAQVVAKKDINLDASKIKTHRGTTYTNSSGETRKVGVVMKAGGNIDMKASDIASRADNCITAGGNVTLRAKLEERCTKRETKSSCLGLVKRTEEVWKTKVTGSNVKSTAGRNIISAGGSISSVAATFTSHEGNQMFAEDDISLKNLVTQTRKCTTKDVAGGLLYHSHRTENQDVNHGTLVEDTSTRAQTTIMSKKGDINLVGSSITSKGNASLIALEGKVECMRKKLQHSSQTESSGFNFGALMDGKLEYGYRNERETRETVDNSGISCAGNLTVNAKEMSALNSFKLDVGGNAEFDVDTLTLKAAELKSEKTSHEITAGLDITDQSASLTYKYSESKSTIHQNQCTSVKGQMILKNVKSAHLSGANADVGSISGNVENMHIESLQDTH